MIWGVSGGLGAYFDVNPAFYRVGFAVLTLLGGAGLLMYIAAALVIPEDGTDTSILEDALRNQRERPWRLVAIGLVAVAVIALLSHAQLWPHSDFAWILLLLAGLALVGSWRRSERVTTGSSTGSTPEPRRSRSFPLASVVLGVLVIAAGVLGALDHWGVSFSWSVALAAAAVLVGVTLVAAAFLRLRIGGLALIGLLLGTAALAASTIDVHLNEGIGSRSYAPLLAAGIKPSYALGIGNLELDLGHVRLPAGKTQIEARVGIGKLHVLVPANANVRIESHVGWGDSRVLGDDQNGHDVTDTVIRGANPAQPTIVLDAHVGAGQVEVDRATP
jgi:phage shock protein PspC (stress-responsive transcriptional regulator)